jgi:hypothetical protein
LEESLSELNDKEMKELILTEEEAHSHKVLWNNMYEDWIRDK